MSATTIMKLKKDNFVLLENSNLSSAFPRPHTPFVTYEEPLIDHGRVNLSIGFAWKRAVNLERVLPRLLLHRPLFPFLNRKPWQPPIFVGDCTSFVIAGQF